MYLKRSPFSIQDKIKSDLDNIKEYRTKEEFLEERVISLDFVDYWDKECKLNPSHPHCLVYED